MCVKATVLAGSVLTVRTLPFWPDSQGSKFGSCAIRAEGLAKQSFFGVYLFGGVYLGPPRNVAVCPTPLPAGFSLNLVKPVLPSCSVLVPLRAS
jgi:hypothetical protein